MTIQLKNIIISGNNLLDDNHFSNNFKLCIQVIGYQFNYYINCTQSIVSHFCNCLLFLVSYKYYPILFIHFLIRDTNKPYHNVGKENT